MDKRFTKKYDENWRPRNIHDVDYDKVKDSNLIARLSVEAAVWRFIKGETEFKNSTDPPYIPQNILDQNSDYKRLSTFHTS